MMKRAKGVTLAEILEATGWLAHTVRGFVSILGSKGGQKGRHCILSLHLKRPPLPLLPIPTKAIPAIIVAD
jgi:hypothetical protein